MTRPQEVKILFVFVILDMLEMVSYVEWLKEHMFSRLKGQITGAGFQNGWKKAGTSMGCVQKSGKQAHCSGAVQKKKAGRADGGSR